MTYENRETYRRAVGTFFGVDADRVSLFARGRVALYALLRARDIGSSDDVILPAFTCVAVANAIMYAGARPIWVDIDPSTYVIDPAAVERAITRRTRAIVAQNTFGLSADIQQLKEIAARKRIDVIDDSTHGLGGHYAGRPSGASSPYAFFSTQWSKPVSTGLGGFALAQDANTADRLRRLELAAREPSALRTASLMAALRARERVGNGRLMAAGRRAYRGLSQAGAVPGSSTSEELDGAAMPAEFVMRLSESQARLGSVRIQEIASVVDTRRAIARIYTDWLTAHSRTAVVELPRNVHSFLRYPIRVSDRTTFLKRSSSAGIDIGDWFVSPVHPVVDGLDRWAYHAGSAPEADLAAKEIVNLPTDMYPGSRSLGVVLRFLGDNVGLIR
jgi:dTDP-4-amino-4,6-dideoxygalactose transaminase